ncbi:rhomboid-related protein 2-like [Contarinia nasturtii]|uniref:rhomboid-related protein 2-like n=1 Tax=Contarinia nasturtii TaxID=265458 RepID=UPI0012D4B0F0|nr:rhomboid-related protein 2-like [Contarinia nasturtii]
MSSISNSSWCTAENSSNESIKFIDGVSGKSSNLKVFYTVDSEIKAQNANNDAQNCQILLRTNERIEQKSKSDSRTVCFGKTLQFVQEIKEFYTWKVPWIIILLSVVQVVVYFVACNVSIARLTFNPHLKTNIWRYFTYHSVHFNLTHLMLNVVLQVLIALPLETTEGHLRVLIVYFSGVVFGAIGSLLFNPTQSIVGSSGGVFSLLFGHMSQCTLNWRIISYRSFRMTAILLLFFSDLLFSVLKHIYWSSVEPKISFSAHICGSVAGYFTGLLVFKKEKRRRSPTEY